MEAALTIGLRLAIHIAPDTIPKMARASSANGNIGARLRRRFRRLRMMGWGAEADMIERRCILQRSHRRNRRLSAKISILDCMRIGLPYLPSPEHDMCRPQSTMGRVRSRP